MNDKEELIVFNRGFEAGKTSLRNSLLEMLNTPPWAPWGKKPQANGNSIHGRIQTVEELKSLHLKTIDDFNSWLYGQFKSIEEGGTDNE